ncbi:MULTISPECIES: Hsp20/alpha crystallin family protein [Sphingomonadales]|jgi:HSP20 family molecular chaperone IbpA|uniref:Hsp20/alpha crystallin family protein n=1 Tax=Tsuneonella suprasediminis TaxID=2306996 RepID=A0A419R5C4_9SPHN|nr:MULTISPECIES: Hsp20/alpha crystallin family protein [Sphingomonadales]RJX70538.1 Hsp20/alpha crystallin family protein [Tsuneonella suprasediminis]BBB08984.1 heat shock protein Hsp20 [Sphingopyxis sp. EG6]|tara:strand:+ start:211 stop:603 length:393 start_codon:yes stop_codon:yes gene_type:complete
MSNDMETTTNEKLAQQAEQAQPVQMPLTDIVETSDGAILLIELPGCSSDDLDIELANGVLTVAARPSVSMPQEGELQHIEFVSTAYERSFQVSKDFDPDKTDASMRDGVLTLRLHRSEKLAPRKISVKAG